MEALLTKLSFGISIFLKLLILYLLIKRRLQQRFFWFFVYIVYELIESTVRLGVSGNRTLYSTIYWWTEIGDVALSVLAFRESFLNVFREYTRLRWFVSILWGCIASALLYALFKALVFPPVQANRRGAIIIGLEVAINFALAVLGILYLLLTRFFKIKEHQWESGIISGFTIYVCLAICGFLIRSIFGTRFRLLNAWLGPVGFILAEATWVLELSRPERKVSTPIQDLTIDDLTNLNQYIKIFGRFLGRKP